MRSKAETLRLIVTTSLKFLEQGRFQPISEELPRESDPLWQVGHAAFDTCRALISPFHKQDATATRFGDCFHGQWNRQPWNRQRPEPSEVFAWWQDILDQAEEILKVHALDEALREPVAFTAYTVHRVDEAYDYVIYHTSFHLGIAYADPDRHYA